MGEGPSLDRWSETALKWGGDILVGNQTAKEAAM